jgi:hypothetical protein
MSTEELPAREAMEFDVVIVGAGPAGLAAAIRLKQLAPDLGVVVVEKGSEVGAHILSGAVIDPIALDKLLPDWRTEDTPIKTAVSDDRFYWLLASASVRLPNFMMPPLMSNHGNYIVSLGKRSGSRSIRALPRPRCCSTATARSPESPPAIWASPRTAITRIRSPAAWSSRPSTRCSPKARAAA